MSGLPHLSAIRAADSSRWTRVGVRAHAVGIALGAVIAFYLASRLSLVWRFPVFSDEAAYAVWTQTVHDSPADRFISLANGKEPLLTWLGAVLVWAGVGAITSLRLISFAAGLGSLTAAALVGRRLGGPWTGVVAAATYALLPLFVVHDVLGLMDPLVAGTAMLALYLVLRLAEQPRLDLALGLGLVLGAGVLTKASGRVTVLLVLSGLMLLPWRSERIRRVLAGWIGCTALAFLVAGVLHAILKLSSLYYQQAKIEPSAVSVRSFHAAFAHPLRWFEAEWPGFQTALGGYLTIPVALLVVTGIAYGLRARTRLTVVLVIWSAVPLAADVLFTEASYPRYLLSAIAPLTVLAAHGGVELARATASLRRGNRWVRAGVAGVAVAAVSQALALTASVLADPATARYPGLDDAQFVTGWTAGHPWSGAAREIRRLAAGEKALVEVGDLYSGALQLDLRDDTGITFVRSDAPGTENARFAVENGVALPKNAGPGELRVVWEEMRPRHGVPLKLFERGITVNRRFVVDAEGLRRAIGGDDRTFDAYIGSHRDVYDWYAWLEAQTR